MRRYRSLKTTSIMGLMCFLMVFTAVSCSRVRPTRYYYNFKQNPSQEDIFIELRNRLNDPLQPKERTKIFFSLGEYYFQNQAFHEAHTQFQKIADEHAPGPATLLANVYLIKLAERGYGSREIDAVKKEIFKEKFVLLFEEYKKMQYDSYFLNTYDVLYYVDRIQVFLNGGSFALIAP